MISDLTRSWAERMRSGDVLDVVAMGDSWTLGNCADGWLEAEKRGADPALIFSSWASQLHRTLNTINPAMRWHNVGRSGWRCEQGLENYDDLVAAKSPSLLLLNFGINDWKNGIAPEAFRHQIKEIVRRTQAHGCGCLIWTAGPVSVRVGNDCGWPKPVDNSKIPWPLEAFHQALRTLAAETGVNFVDVAREMESRIGRDGERWMVDAMHLNQRGHDAIHESIAVVLLRMLTPSDGMTKKDIISRSYAVPKSGLVDR